jgi:hypothetical protein
MGGLSYDVRPAAGARENRVGDDDQAITTGPAVAGIAAHDATATAATAIGTTSTTAVTVCAATATAATSEGIGVAAAAVATRSSNIANTRCGRPTRAASCRS